MARGWRLWSMQRQSPPFDPDALDAFVALVGARAWAARMAGIASRAASGPRAGRAIRQRHGLELAIERLRGTLTRPPALAELHAAHLAKATVRLHRELSPRGKVRLRERLVAALHDDGTLVPLFHLLRTAELQRSRGFKVDFAGLEDGVPWDLVIRRDALEAEIVCDIVSAEEGRLVRRHAWVHLTDRVEPDVMAWLGANPGRYLLRMSLPLGLGEDVQQRIHRLLHSRQRWDHDAAAVLRLTPLVLVEDSLRREFGAEAHLSVITAEPGVLVMAARAGALDEVGAVVRRRLGDIAPARLSGLRPGIISVFVDDLDREEWRGLRERLELESEARQFLAGKVADAVVAVTCASRFELFGMTAPDAAEGGELRFRNPTHPAARSPALAPAVLSSV